MAALAAKDGDVLWIGKATRSPLAPVHDLSKTGFARHHPGYPRYAPPKRDCPRDSFIIFVGLEDVIAKQIENNIPNVIAPVRLRGP